MKTSSNRLLSYVVGLALAGGLPAWAADAAPASGMAEASADALPLPEEQQSGNVRYLSGGVPDEQLPAIKKARSHYPLVVELYQKSGGKSEYTSGAQVQLTDKAGKQVLDVTAEGPFLLIKLPPGSYRVQATLEGKTVKGPVVNVAAKGSRRAVIVFPQGTD